MPYGSQHCVNSVVIWEALVFFHTSCLGGRIIDQRSLFCRPCPPHHWTLIPKEEREIESWWCSRNLPSHLSWAIYTSPMQGRSLRSASCVGAHFLPFIVVLSQCCPRLARPARTWGDCLTFVVVAADSVLLLQSLWGKASLTLPASSHYYTGVIHWDMTGLWMQ